MLGLVQCLCWLLLCVSHCESRRKLHKLLPGRLVPRFDYFQDCEINTTLPARILWSKIEIADAAILVDADYELRKWFYKITELTIKFENCADTTLSSCQHFQNMRFKNDNMCALVSMKDQLWSGLLKTMTPPANCPQSPGIYKMRNGTMNMEILTRLPFPLEKHYWRIRGEIFAPTMYICVDMGLRFLRTRT